MVSVSNYNAIFSIFQTVESHFIEIENAMSKTLLPVSNRHTSLEM